MTLEQLLTAADGTGIYTVVLPFLLVFAVSYGLLSKLSLFGDKSRQVNAVIGTAVALYAVSNPAVHGFGQGFIAMYGGIGLLLVFALTAMIAMGLANVTPSTHGRAYTVIGAALGLAAVAVIASAGGLALLGVPTSIVVSMPAISGQAASTAAMLAAGVAGIAYMVRAG